MIQLTGISLVYWHLFTVADIRFAGNTAILGKNATGKSTLIDLIQAVMTGGSANYYKFNRSAGEGGTRSDRTLRSYCLGQTDEGVARRKQGITHLVLNFAGAGLPKPISLGLCIEVRENEDARVVGRYVATGVSVDSSMLTDSTGGAARPCSWPELKVRLEHACAEVGGELFDHHATSAPKFIREYMRLLFTGRRAPDPDRFIKAFIMALSFEDMRSVEDFVCKYLLEKADIDIADLRESVQRYRQIQEAIAELDRKLAALVPIREEIARLMSLLEQEDTVESMRRLAELMDASKEHYRLLGLRRKKTDEKRRLDEEMSHLAQDIEFSSAELDSVLAQIATSGIEGKRHQLGTEIDLEKERHARLVLRLRERHTPVAAALKLLDIREAIQPLGLGLGGFLDDLARIREESAQDIPPAWPRNPTLMESLIASASSTATDRLAKVEAKRDSTLALRVASEGRAADVGQRLAESRKGRLFLNRNVAGLMELLREKGMRPRAVCQVLDLVDERWRLAVEALLGRDRETIIVDPEHAEEAVTLLRRERSVYPGCRIANTRKLRQQVGQTPAPGSLASMLSGEDEIAMAFAIFRLGGVRLANTQSELMADNRAVMTDGTYYDGLVVEVRTAGEFKVGRVAATLMTGVLEKEFADETANAKVHLATERLLNDLYGRLERLAKPFEAEDGLVRLATAMSDIDARRADAEDRLSRVDQLVDPQLEASRKRLASHIGGLREEREGNQKAIGSLENELSQLSRALGGAQELKGSRWSVKIRLRHFLDRISSVALFRRLRPKYLELRGTKADSAVARDLEAVLKRLAAERQGCDALIRDKVSDYLYSFAVQRPFDANSSIILHMKPWIEQTLEVLEGNDMVRYRSQADEAAERITYFFRTSFVQEINSRFRDLEREIDDVRQALRSKQLHGEVYSLHAIVKPEFRDLHRLARESEHDDKVLSLLFSDEGSDHPYSKVVQEVERLLRDETSGFERYQDYRNYYTFELRMKKVDDGHETTYDRRRNTASGAERQVPFYVIIGAALSSIYHGTRRNDDVRGLGLAVFDEAFSKMDGQNQRTMLQFYNEIGLQVLIAAPTEKRAVVYENLDSVVDVYRFGNSAEAEVSKIKERVRDAMREANPDHLTDEALLLRLGEAAPGDDEGNGTTRDEAVY